MNHSNHTTQPSLPSSILHLYSTMEWRAKRYHLKTYIPKIGLISIEFMRICTNNSITFATPKNYNVHWCYSFLLQIEYFQKFSHINFGNSCTVKTDYSALRTLTLAHFPFAYTNIHCLFVWNSTFWNVTISWNQTNLSPPFEKICHLRLAVTQAFPKLYRVHWKTISDQHFFHSFTHSSQSIC